MYLNFQEQVKLFKYTLQKKPQYDIGVTLAIFPRSAKAIRTWGGSTTQNLTPSYILSVYLWQRNEVKSDMILKL